MIISYTTAVFSVWDVMMIVSEKNKEYTALKVGKEPTIEQLIENYCLVKGVKGVVGSKMEFTD